MKREGRQHGMVSTKELLRNSRPSAKIINGFGSPPTPRSYSKVSSKPTNHSKFTGKCARPRCMECHTLPVCKSRDKAKGAQKLRSCDVATNHRLIAWRIMDKGVGQNYSGVSATGLLSHLSGCYREDMDDGIDDDDHDAGVIKNERSTFEDEMVAQSDGVEETVASSEISIGVEETMAIGEILIDVEGTATISPSEIKIGGDSPK
ncbi:B3 DNA binding domain-containing protein [Cinnamomum micranthum f. kanehirae]|uniref:B3 DNA binding domain-containing protein n=1 Tax=Cinnamomum micranthum f. kanehirae TaxID=337451 RepID=A0A3S3M8Y3_9MAGN|nr:B3 DNA binding domain-containing protein [Cinnamomum micranthum f. kanehirae]